MATLDELKPLLQETYLRYWADWYLAHPECKPARLSLTQDSANKSPCYDRRADAITVLVAGGDLRLKRNVLLIGSDDAWFVWQGTLIHEMLHEYECKILSTPTKDGQALRASWLSNRRFVMFHDQAQTHGEMFFTVICDRAPYFSMTPEGLLNKMW